MSYRENETATNDNNPKRKINNERKGGFLDATIMYDLKGENQFIVDMVDYINGDKFGSDHAQALTQLRFDTRVSDYVQSHLKTPSITNTDEQAIIRKDSIINIVSRIPS